MELLFLQIDVPRRKRSRLRQVRNERGWQESAVRKRTRYESEEEEDEGDNDDDEAILVGALFALRNSTGTEAEDDDREDRDEDLKQEAKAPMVKQEHKRSSAGRGRNHRADQARDESAWKQGMSAPKAAAGQFYAGDAAHAGPSTAFGGQGLGLGSFNTVLPTPGDPAYCQRAPGRANGAHWTPENLDGLASTGGQERLASADSNDQYKRSASHVYIAHFIADQTALRLRQAQAHAHLHTTGNGFPLRYSSDANEHKLPANGDLGPNRQPAPAGQLDVLSNGVSHSLPGPADSSQALPSSSVANPFLAPNTAGLHHMHGAGLQGLNPAYAQMLSQQPGGFPFLQGVNLGGFNPQSLANFPMFQSHLMGFPAGLQSQLAAVASGANGMNAAPVLPKAPLPADLPELPKQMPPHVNGGLKQQQDANAAALVKLGIPPLASIPALAGLDLVKLKAMAPHLFDASGNLAPQLVDGMKPTRSEQPVMENWGPSMSMRLS